MGQEILCSEGIFRERDIAADCPVVQRKQLIRMLKLIVATQILQK